MKNAFDSGAQITSTDYYMPDLRISDYHVQWPEGGPGRANIIISTGKPLTE
jgi:hypothetical protein